MCGWCSKPAYEEITVGKKVRVKTVYRGKIKIYDSKVIQLHPGKQKCYKIHYIGYNNRHDKWVSENDICPEQGIFDSCFALMY